MHLSIEAKNHALVPEIRFFATVIKIRTYKVIVSCTCINLRCYASGEIKFRFLNAAADTHARAHAEIKDTPCFARKRALPEKLQRSSSPLEDRFYSFYNSRVQRRKWCNIPSHLKKTSLRATSTRFRREVAENICARTIVRRTGQIIALRFPTMVKAVKICPCPRYAKCFNEGSVKLRTITTTRAVMQTRMRPGSSLQRTMVGHSRAASANSNDRTARRRSNFLRRN